MCPILNRMDHTNDLAGPELRLAPRLDGLLEGHKLLCPDRITLGFMATAHHHKLS